MTRKINFTEWKKTMKLEIEIANERMEHDFLNAFEWGYHEKRYEEEFKYRFLSNFEDETPVDAFLHEVKAQIFNRLPLSTSSSDSSNRAKVLEVNALNYLIKNANWYSIK